MMPCGHRVAQEAYTLVSAREGTPWCSAYVALAHKFPVLVLQNGLAQSTGFLLAKGRDEHLALLDDLAQVLTRTGEDGCATPVALHRTVIRAGLDQTMHLTRRTLEAAGWIKRYVQGVLNVAATGQEQGGGAPKAQPDGPPPRPTPQRREAP